MSGRTVEWGDKPPLANLNYAFDLSDWIQSLPLNDVISTVELLGVTPTDIQITGPDWSQSPYVILVVSGGVHGTRYAIPIKVTSTTGLTDEFVALLGVVDPMIEVADRIGIDQAG